MNKYEKQYTKAQLLEEWRTMKELKKSYEKAKEDVEQKISELNARRDLQNIESIVHQKKYQQIMLKQINGVLEDLNNNQYNTMGDFFKGSYITGYSASVFGMHKQDVPLIFPVDPETMEGAIKTKSKLSAKYYQNREFHENISTLRRHIRQELTRGIASGKSWLDVANEVAYSMNSPFRRAQSDAYRIVRTEGHRINQQGFLDAGNMAKKRGADVVKQWDATLDGRTRPEHQEADGQIKEWDEYFDVGGEKMKAPGVGGSARNVCNCRCQLLQRARWALDEDELNTLKSRAAYYGLDKTKDFEKFKSKYMKYPVNADIMNGLTPLEAKDLDENLQETIRSYTSGHYKHICEYSQYLKTPNGRVDIFDNREKWIKEELPNISEDTRRDTKALMKAIESQPVKDAELTRVEKSMPDVKSGDSIVFGIRSTSANPDFTKLVYSDMMEGIDYEDKKKDFTEYHFLTSRSLDISDYSEFTDQDERLICGKYKVVDVKEIQPVSPHWENTEIPYKELFPGAEPFTSKKGREMVRYTENGVEKTMTKEKYETGTSEDSRWISEKRGRRVIYLEVI